MRSPRRPRGMDRVSGCGDGRAGFTLIEVMVALLIFTLAAVVLGGSYVNVLNSYFIMGASVRAADDVMFARAALLSEPDRDKAEEGGEFTRSDRRRVRWKATIEPTNVADLFTVAFHCEVDDPERPKPTTTEQTFRLLRPTWSKSDERAKLREEAKQRIIEAQEVRR